MRRRGLSRLRSAATANRPASSRSMPVETIDRSAGELKAEAARVRADVDNFFARLLAPTGDGRERLFEAMRHAVIGGGKRLRPMLTIAASRLFAIDPERALRVGCAIEAIHVYSLIHDDLPCMDDADLIEKMQWLELRVIAQTDLRPNARVEARGRDS